MPADVHAARVPQQVVHESLRPRRPVKAPPRLERAEAGGEPVSPVSARLTWVAAMAVQAETASAKPDREEAKGVLSLL